MRSKTTFFLSHPRLYAPTFSQRCVWLGRFSSSPGACMKLKSGVRFQVDYKEWLRILWCLWNALVWRSVCHSDESWTDFMFWDLALYWQILIDGVLRFKARLKGMRWPNKFEWTPTSGKLCGINHLVTLFNSSPVWMKDGKKQIHSDGGTPAHH